MILKVLLPFRALEEEEKRMAKEQKKSFNLHIGKYMLELLYSGLELETPELPHNIIYDLYRQAIR